MKPLPFLQKVSQTLTQLSWLVRKNSTPTAASDKAVIRHQAHQGITWIDVTDPTKKDLHTLTEPYDFDPLEIKACVSKRQLDRIEVEKEYFFILWHAPRYNKKINRITTTQLGFFLGKDYLITTHKSSHGTLIELFTEITTNSDKREELFKKSAATLAYAIFETLTKETLALIETISQEVDEIEDLVFDVSTSGAYEITQMRQKILRLKRVIVPFKNILQQLADSDPKLTNSMSRNFRYLANEVNKARESLEDAKEVIEIYKDADFTMSTDRTNKILGILTIIFTLAIPAQIVGSFYGMNVLIPGGLEAGPWEWLGPFTTFYFVIGVATIPAVLMLWLFKHKRWF